MTNARVSAAAAIVLLLSFAGLAAAASAAEPAAPPPGKLADFWTFWPKAGHAADFEAAVKKHLAWRKQAGESFAWEAYQPMLGTDLGHYVFRSGEHHWADFDAEQEWAQKNKADQEFERDVMPHVERYEHTMEEDDYEHSKWQQADYNYFWVIRHRVKPGSSQAMAAAIDKIHKGLVAGGWPRSYAVSRTIGGRGGLTLVFPYMNHAGMEDPTPGLMEVMTKGAGSAEAAAAAFAAFDAGVAETDESIYVLRRDLSTPK